jgi:hypothetical protein
MMVPPSVSRSAMARAQARVGDGLGPAIWGWRMFVLVDSCLDLGVIVFVDPR